MAVIPLSSSYEILFKPHQDGLRFILSYQNQNISTSEWKTIKKNIPEPVKSKINVLFEWLEEDFAHEKEEYVELSPENTSKITDDFRLLLDLPEIYPYGLGIEALGNFAERDFRYRLSYIRHSGNSIVNPQRLGAWLHITSEERFLLNEQQFVLISKMDSFNQMSDKEKTLRENLLIFSEVKPIAVDVGAKLDEFLRNEDVNVKTEVQIKFHENGEILEVIPELEHLSEEETEQFEKQFKNSLEVSEKFDLLTLQGERERIVPDRKVMEGLRQIKKIEKLEGEDVENFLNYPQTFLDPDCIDLSQFSARVKGLGFYQPKIIPFLREPRQWLPDEDLHPRDIPFVLPISSGLKIEGPDGEVDEIEFKNLEELERFENQFATAQMQEKRTFEWNGIDIPITEQLKNALKPIRRRYLPTENEDVLLDEKNEPRVIIIYENIDASDELYKEADSKLEIDFSTLPKPELPECLAREISLLPHQNKGLSWLQHLRFQRYGGALLADDMGLGKTLQTLAYLAKEKERNEESLPSMVVAPLVVIQNWEREIENFFGGSVFLPILTLHGTELNRLRRSVPSKHRPRGELDIKRIQENSFVVTTYETIRDFQLDLGKIKWDTVILDEAQNIKTPGILVTTAVKALQANFKIACTGTPVENSLIDLWSIVDFVTPGHLGILKDFNSEIQNPIRKGGEDARIAERKLLDRLFPVYLRRNKKGNLEGLPEKMEHIYKDPMPEVQKRIYLQETRIAQDKKGNGGEKGWMLKLIGRLRDISAYPFIPYHDPREFQNQSIDTIIESSARLIRLIKIVDDIQNKEEKGLIFIRNRTFQRIVQRILSEKYTLEVDVINGNTPGSTRGINRTRQIIIDDFQRADGFNLLILSPEAAGVGLNISSANHVVHLTRLWNPAKEDQATDRCYRIGQKKDVHVHLPLSVLDDCVSFDVTLDKLLSEKRDLSKRVGFPMESQAIDGREVWGEIIRENIDGDNRNSDVLDLEGVDRLNSDMFEACIGALYEKQGYSVKITPRSADRGLDVIAEKKDISLLIECKHTSKRTTRTGVEGGRQVLMGKNNYRNFLNYPDNIQLLVWTNASSFTPQAIEEAEGTEQLDLFCRKNLKKMLDDFPVTLMDASRMLDEEVFISPR